MRVLWATANLPDPTLGGGPSIEHEWLAWAAARHEVTLITGGLRPGQVPPASVAELPLAEVVAAGAPDPRAPSRLGLLRRSLHGAPFELAVAQPRVARIAVEVMARPADLVQVMWAETAPVALVSAALRPTAFFACDAFVRHARRRLEAADTLSQRVYWRLQLARTATWERGYRSAGTVAVASPLDAATLAGLGVDASVLPSPLAGSWFAPLPDVTVDPELVSFIGALDYGPNVDAVQWLTTEIWPRIRAQRPEARLRVVGRHPVPAVVDAVTLAGGELVGDVDDVRPHYRRSGVVVLPIRLGSGVRTKVLHALACQAPIVATSTALEGLPLTSGLQALVADDADGLAAAALDALADPAAARGRADRGARIAEAHRSDVALAAFGDLWDRVVAGGDR